MLNLGLTYLIPHLNYNRNKFKKKNQNTKPTLKKIIQTKHKRNRTTDNTQMNGHVDEQDTKEEEVYQDLCSIQWATRPQV